MPASAGHASRRNPMRFAMVAAAALAIAGPAAAQSITITNGNPGPPNALHQDSAAARSDAQLNRAEARTDQRVAHQDAAHGNYVGAAEARQDSRDNRLDARHDSAVA